MLSPLSRFRWRRIPSSIPVRQIRIHQRPVHEMGAGARPPPGAWVISTKAGWRCIPEDGWILAVFRRFAGFSSPGTRLAKGLGH
jgi:hypothetical protein